EVLAKRYSVNPDERECMDIGEFCHGRNCIFVTYRSLLNEGQQQLGKVLSNTAVPRLQVSVDTPYDLLVMPDWPNCVASYDPSDLAMEALALVICGDKEPLGTCPIDLRVAA